MGAPVRSNMLNMPKSGPGDRLLMAVGKRYSDMAAYYCGYGPGLELLKNSQGG